VFLLVAMEGYGNLLDMGVLVPEKKYLKIRVLSVYGRSDNCRGFPINPFNPCFQLLLAWDEYSTETQSVPFSIASGRVDLLPDTKIG